MIDKFQLFPPNFRRTSVSIESHDRLHQCYRRISTETINLPEVGEACQPAV